MNGDGGSHISIDFLGCIEIELLKRINYDKIYDFIYELIIFLQLYCPDRFSVQKIHVMIDNVFYRCSVPLPETRIKGKHVQNTVRADLLSFLKKCYMNIPYRNSKSEIRNIPYIVLKTSRSLEDNFLMFYRFIECYYKKRESKNSCNFISSALSEHYAKCHHLAAEELEKFTQEIICLRNH